MGSSLWRRKAIADPNIGTRIVSDTSETSTSGVREIADIAYKARASLSEYEQVSCNLDLYLPVDSGGFPTLVWLHGGALKEGDKRDDLAVVRSLARSGIAVASANYRLSPKTTFPSYLEDAAAAFAWTREHIAEYGGDPDNVFLGGHSAGGYVALMICLDERYLRALGTNNSAIRGLIPISAQTMTHYTVREERGVGPFTVVADEAAPVHYCRKDTPPMLLLYADNDLAARAEENAYFLAIMRWAENDRVTARRIDDRDHGSIASHIADDGDPARMAILAFIAEKINAAD